MESLQFGVPIENIGVSEIDPMEQHRIQLSNKQPVWNTNLTTVVEAGEK